MFSGKLKKVKKFLLMLLAISCLLLLNNAKANPPGVYDKSPLYVRFSAFSTYIVEQKYPEAKQELQKIISIHTTDSDIQLRGHFELGFIDINLKNYSQSIREFQYVFDHSYAEDTDAQFKPIAAFQIGWNYMQLKQYDKATTQFAYILDCYEDTIEIPFAIHQWVQCLEVTNQNKQIEPFLKEMIQKYSSTRYKYNALADLAAYYGHHNLLTEALATWQQIKDELSIKSYPELKGIKESAEKLIPEIQRRLND